MPCHHESLARERKDARDFGWHDAQPKTSAERVQAEQSVWSRNTADRMHSEPIGTVQIPDHPRDGPEQGVPVVAGYSLTN